jgi:hypothetical protein
MKEELQERIWAFLQRSRDWDARLRGSDRPDAC